MKKMLVIGVVACALQGYSDSSVHEEIISRLSVPQSSFSADYTNRLVRYAEQTNGHERATALSALAVAMFDRFDEGGDVGAIDASAWYASNVVYDCSVASNSWQKAAASIVYASTFSQDGKFLKAYSVCTNAMSLAPQEPISDSDRRIWNALCRHHSSCGLNVGNALRFYAAMSSLMADAGLNCSEYTNALPAEALSKIRQITE